MKHVLLNHGMTTEDIIIDLYNVTTYQSSKASAKKAE